MPGGQNAVHAVVDTFAHLALQSSTQPAPTRHASRTPRTHKTSVALHCSHVHSAGAWGILCSICRSSC
ncbi:uncharacterized protein BKA78DRAFT_314495 [Phyllosticta capitalensis]|uniref:uncharacterized protein n=1 Tax=Phyllosticta capitalensis TaxID=121624 RepID=UPI003132751D